MRRIGAAFGLTAAFLISSFCQPAMALDNLFSGDLFPEEKSDKPLFSDFKFGTPAPGSSDQPKKDPEAEKRAYREMVDRDDDTMRQQIQKVASWLQEFSMRNQNRFPGVYGSSNTIGRASETQLTELVGANPYANAFGGVNDRELSGLAPGLSYYYGPNGVPMGGSPLANDEYTGELTADSANRIHLQMDENISDNNLNQYRNDPPGSWEAAPGTITGAGDGEGHLYVWGTGIDGKPLKNPGGQGVYIVSAQTANTVEDQGQEAGY